MATIRGLKQIKMQSSTIKGVKSFSIIKRWTPADLFANGQTGFWLDARDSSTMRQNSGGTGAVNINDPVGWWTTKAGMSLNFIQATSGRRPTFLNTNALQFVSADDQQLRVTGVTPWARHGLVAAAWNYFGTASHGTDPRIVSVASSGSLDYNTDGNFTLNARSQYQRSEFLMDFDPSTTNDGTQLFNEWHYNDVNADSDTLPNTLQNTGDGVHGTFNGGTAQPSYTPIWDRISIGSRDTGEETFNGYIGDVIMRMERLSTDELSYLRNYLMLKYLR